MNKTKVNITVEKYAPDAITTDVINMYALMTQNDKDSKATTDAFDKKDILDDIVDGSLYLIKTGAKVIGYVKLGVQESQVGKDFEGLVFVKPYMVKPFRKYGIMRSVISRIAALMDKEDKILLMRAAVGGSLYKFASSLTKVVGKGDKEKTVPLFTVVANDVHNGKDSVVFSTIANRVDMNDFTL